eukprot:1036600-Prorocentrum_lima.AAC.1
MFTEIKYNALPQNHFAPDPLLPPTNFLAGDAGTTLLRMICYIFMRFDTWGAKLHELHNALT